MAERKDRGLEKIQSILRAHSEFFRHRFSLRSRENPSSSFFLNRIFEFYFQAADHTAVYAEKCHAVIDEIIAAIVDAAETGIRDGSIRTDLDPMKTAVTCGNLLLFLCSGCPAGRTWSSKVMGMLPENS